ncbi:acetolactate synthase [Yinghuangia seranimata]|uniref:acetolactate synthase n=1 Tax=Yinghuangia seranimata TaxID=408067 RepID=UPI00248BF6CB|nr:acetolactate synthase [Yinghuangia seranimata]MDI2128071.1 acetolactate synthase [Yinghuangia seranimata]
MAGTDKDAGQDTGQDAGHGAGHDPAAPQGARANAAPPDTPPGTVAGHGGDLVVAAARAYGVDTLFTLSGGHVFPVYDAAVRAAEPLRVLDVRHEQTAVFAAEATAKLTRRAGFAVLTAGPGVTNGISAVTTAHLNGSPLVVLGGRAPAFRWGSGALQELDHPPLLAPVTKHAATVHETDRIGAELADAFALAERPRRGPVFLDVPMDVLFDRTTAPAPVAVRAEPVAPDPVAVATAAGLLADAQRPVLVLGQDVWMGRAEEAARRAAETMGVPVVANGMGRGVLPTGHELLVTRARVAALGGADLVVVVGAPLDFRLGYGVFGGRDGAVPARVLHLVDSPEQLSATAPVAASVCGDLTLVLDGLVDAWERQAKPGTYRNWFEHMQAATRTAAQSDRALLRGGGDPIHPVRIYGELLRVLADDAVVVGDGGDFVSYAGKYVEPGRPGGWLDPGPYGCLGTGLGYAVAARLARPDAQVVVLLGDGAAGFSLMDAYTLVRHNLPVVMVVGNNGVWGLEKHPMRKLYGHDVAATLAPETRYDEVVRALGGAGETVRRADDIEGALARAFASGVPYLVNVLTDPDAVYPRSTMGV